ncbi:MAG: ABC transporter ATP-binding protein [Halanaerobiales bacterium]
MAGVTLENVSKHFDDVVAVEDANLEVRDKEFLVLVGPSGCGKSTTLRMIAGLEEATEGIIKIGDEVVNDVAPKDRDIAMVFQNYALYPHMNVYDNMGFGLKLRKFDKEIIDERVQNAARILGIEELLERKPKELSGGQRQRVALGRAIVREPRVFLMDEPLSNLDAKLRVQMRTELSKLHERLQTTVIYVTHDQTEAMTMGDRIVVLNDGVIQQVDDPLTLYNSPVNMFVAGFIGSPAMNFMDAVVLREGNEYYLDGHGSFKIKIPESKLDKYPQTKEYTDREVVMGIRPENLFDASLQHDIDITEENSFQAVVDVVEPMGSEIYLYLKADDHEMIAEVEAESTADVKDKLKIGVNTNRLHIFDKETEEAVF